MFCAFCSKPVAPRRPHGRHCSRACQRAALRHEDRLARQLYGAARRIVLGGLNTETDPDKAPPTTPANFSAALGNVINVIAYKVGRKTRCGVVGVACFGSDDQP